MEPQGQPPLFCPNFLVSSSPKLSVAWQQASATSQTQATQQSQFVRFSVRRRWCISSAGCPSAAFSALQAYSILLYRKPTQNAWSKGTNPVTQRPSQPNGVAPPKPTAPSAKLNTGGKETNTPEKHANDRLNFLLANFIVSGPPTCASILASAISAYWAALTRIDTRASQLPSSSRMEIATKGSSLEHRLRLRRAASL